MLSRNKLLAIGALIVGLLLPAQAMAAYEAYTRVDLNLRIGPSISYGVIDVIPAGYPVLVLGCLDDISWCDVEFEGLRGWVAASYLVQPGTAIYLPQLAPRIALPIIVFSFHSYHDRHYRDRPWYKKRSGRWRGRDWRRDRLKKKRPSYERHWDHQEVDRPAKKKRINRARKRQKVIQPQPRRQIRQAPQERRQIKRGEERRQIKRGQERRQIKRSQERRQIKRSQERRQIKRGQERRQIKRSEQMKPARQGQQSRKKVRSRRSGDEPQKRRRR